MLRSLLGAGLVLVVTAFWARLLLRGLAGVLLEELLRGIILRGGFEFLDSLVALFLELVEIALGLADSEVIETGGEGANGVDPVWLHRSVRKAVRKGVWGCGRGKTYTTGPPATAAYSVTPQFCQPRTRAKMME